MENFYSKFKFLWIGMAMFLCMVISVQGFSQDRSVSGTVTSGEDGSTIPGVSIIITGTTIGTITDLDGNFKLDVSEGSSLTLSSVGYVSQTVEVGNQSVIDIVLMTDVKELSEVVVIGYGTREKKDLTGAISTMDSEEIEKTLAFNPEMAMQGQMAGVLVTTPSGLPTDRPTVRIRGVSTFGIADPLYVIDGVPITEFGAGAEQNAAVVQDIRGNINILSTINPNDIESISVLKDASAAAIYGVRASNGVILIETRKGKMERAKVDINLRYGVSNFPKLYDMLAVPEYTRLYQDVYAANPNFELPGYFNPDSVNAVTPYQSYLGDKPTIDWQNPFLTNNAVNMDASAKVYGGTENTNYYVSLGYSQIEAPIKTNEQDRFTLSTNINSKVAKWMEVGLTNRLAYVDIVDRTGEGTGTDNASAPPWQPLLLEDDYYQINSPVEDLGYATVQDSITDTSTDPYGVTWQSKYGEPSAVNMNSLAFQDPALYNNEYRIIRNLANAYLKLKIYKGLSIKGSLSLDYYHNRREWWHSVDQAFFVQTPGNPHATGSGASLGSITYRDKYDHNFIKELVLDWIESFGDHNINITLSAMDQQYGFKFIQTGTSEVQQEDPDKRYIRENQEYTTVGEWIDNSALQGFMARASYNYASKYYVDATVRRDGSSKFAPDYRWGTFPSFALAWRMSAENFMSGVTWLNDLKWRAGWGQLGNQETASFAWLSGVSRAPQYAYGSGLGDAYGNNVNGLFLPDFPNEELSWETSTTLNIGFDAIFFKNRFTATVEWYDRLTEDILQPSALPYSVGNYNNPILNIASVRNRGWEFQLGWRDVAGDFQYFINGNLTTVHNEVMEVWNDQPFGDESARIEKGYPLNYLWGFQVDGIYQSDEEVTNWWNTYSDSQADPALVSEGDMYFKDVHGPPNKDEGYDFYTPYPDSVVDLNDRAYIGSTIPGLYYGLNLGVSWKGIDLTLFFQGIGDVSKVNNARWGGTGMQSRGVNQWTDVENRWTPDNKNQWDPNDKAGSLPRAVLNDPGANTRFSDRWVESGSFMRLRNLTLGYNLPSKWMNNTDYIERCRFYISGMNLWTITNWTGIDPENDDIPIPVTWSFGVNATF